jgi:hypothetical protein
MATPSTSTPAPASPKGVSRSRTSVRVKLDAATLKKIIEADSYVDKDDDGDKRLYEYNCNLRELETYNLLKKMVFAMNDQLKNRQERMRLIEEGDGLYVELE